MNKVITIFGSSKPMPDDSEYRLAFALGSELAKAGYVICNGGYGGTMEAAARGAVESGGKTIGVTFDIIRREPNEWIQREIRVKTLQERLQKLVELGEGYVVLRGGTGTLLELALIWELVNKGIMKEKPIVLLGEFWDPLIQLMEQRSGGSESEGGSQWITRLSAPDDCVPFFAKTFAL